MIPLILIVWSLQARLSAAFDAARTRVGEMLSEVSESVMGAAVVRAYGLDEQTVGRVRGAIDRRYRAEVVAHWRSATLFPLSTVFYAMAVSIVVVLGAGFGPEWGLTFGRVTAFLFLADAFLHVFTDLPEIYSETQTAIAGWRKVLAVLDLPVEIVEPVPGVELPAGALSVRAEDVEYRYREGGRVLHGISLDIEAGEHVAIVGETGCGKTTFVKLVSRLADPEAGRIQVGGIDLREIAAASRHRSLRMVPQDGFLFDTTVRENVRAGREGATDRDVETAFEELGLGGWVAALPQGLDTPVGERGEALSVGERQLVALARAQIARPRAADPRRGDVGRGPGHRAADHRGAAPALGGTHHDHRGAPAVDRRGRRPRVRLRCGPARRDGDARGARGARRDVRRPVRELARQRAGGLSAP